MTTLLLPVSEPSDTSERNGVLTTHVPILRNVIWDSQHTSDHFSQHVFQKMLCKTGLTRVRSFHVLCLTTYSINGPLLAALVLSACWQPTKYTHTADMRHALMKPAFLCYLTPCISLFTLSLSNAALLMVTFKNLLIPLYLEVICTLNKEAVMYLRMLSPILLTTRLHNPDYNNMNTAELFLRVIISSNMERTESKR
jgi:hypothetical protein